MTDTPTDDGAKARHLAAVLTAIEPLERQGGLAALLAGSLKAVVQALFAGPPAAPETPPVEEAPAEAT